MQGLSTLVTAIPRRRPPPLGLWDFVIWLWQAVTSLEAVVFSRAYQIAYEETQVSRLLM